MQAQPADDVYGVIEELGKAAVVVWQLVKKEDDETDGVTNLPKLTVFSTRCTEAFSDGGACTDVKQCEKVAVALEGWGMLSGAAAMETSDELIKTTENTLAQFVQTFVYSFTKLKEKAAREAKAKLDNLRRVLDTDVPPQPTASNNNLSSSLTSDQLSAKDNLEEEEDFVDFVIDSDREAAHSPVPSYPTRKRKQPYAVVSSAPPTYPRDPPRDLVSAAEGLFDEANVYEKMHSKYLNKPKFMIMSVPFASARLKAQYETLDEMVQSLESTTASTDSEPQKIERLLINRAKKEAVPCSIEKVKKLVTDASPKNTLIAEPGEAESERFRIATVIMQALSLTQNVPGIEISLMRNVLHRLLIDLTTKRAATLATSETQRQHITQFGAMEAEEEFVLEGLSSSMAKAKHFTNTFGRGSGGPTNNNNSNNNSNTYNQNHQRTSYESVSPKIGAPRTSAGRSYTPKYYQHYNEDPRFPAPPQTRRYSRTPISRAQKRKPAGPPALSAQRREKSRGFRRS